MRQGTMDDLIQWPRAVYWDKPFNMWKGCEPVSPACDNCYARAILEGRFGEDFSPKRTKKTIKNVPTKGVVFIGNLCDQFNRFVPQAENMELFSWLFHNEKGKGPVPNDATYLFCTKRVRNMADALMNYTEIPNAYFGFTAENQEWFNRRVDCAADIPFRHKLWLSAEPLLGPIDMGDMVKMFKFVVVGCESGANRRPCKLEWIESIVEQCRAASVPVFVKQIDLNGKCERDITKFPKHLQIRQVPWSVKEKS